MERVSSGAQMRLYLLYREGEGCSPNTLELYRFVVEAWHRSGLGAVEYLANLDGTLRLSTRHLYGRVLKQYCAWCYAQGYHDTNPLANMHFRAVAPSGERPFTNAEIERLFESCETPFESAVLMGLYTLGLRASELAAVRAPDLGDGTLLVHGKGNKPRTLATSPAIAQSLLTVAIRQANRGIIYRTVRSVGERAGVQRCHPHRFRHSFGDAFLRRGGDRGDLRLLLGHASYQMVDRYVAYFEAERAVAAHRRFLQAG